MRVVETELLRIAFETGGPEDGRPLLLLHGWPDDVRGWRQVAPRLHARGWRTVAPYLRGFGPTRFHAAQTIRDGRGVALAQDAIDLADALRLETFAVVGHDWGARAAYILAALFPERVSAIVAIALAFQPWGAFHLPSFSQARRFWYQWFLALENGPEALRADPKGFARIQWETWSPATDSPRAGVIRLALRERGYIEGQNIAIEYRYTEGKRDRAAELAAELVRLKVDVIVVAGGEPWVRAAKNATKTIPIVMVGPGIDPVDAGFVESLARPGSNLTGITLLTRKLDGKRLELLKEAVPKVARVAVLYDPADRGLHAT